MTRALRASLDESCAQLETQGLVALNAIVWLLLIPCAIRALLFGPYA